MAENKVGDDLGDRVGKDKVEGNKLGLGNIGESEGVSVGGGQAQSVKIESGNNVIARILDHVIANGKKVERIEAEVRELNKSFDEHCQLSIETARQAQKNSSMIKLMWFVITVMLVLSTGELAALIVLFNLVLQHLGT